MVQVYKILNGIDKVDKAKLFSMETYNRTRGHPLKLFKERPRLNVRANSFSNRVTNTWNQLPEDIVMAPSLNAFKGRLNKYRSSHTYKFTASCYETGTTTLIYYDLQSKYAFRSQLTYIGVYIGKKIGKKIVSETSTVFTFFI